MLQRHRICAAILAIVLFSASLRADDQPLKPALIQGSWTYHGLRNIIGQGSDTTISFKQEQDRWTIAYETVIYPSVNDPNARPTTQRQGPFPVSVEDQELVVQKEQGKPPARYTFLCDKKRLVLPAIVQKKPGEWAYRSEIDSLVIRCDADPFKVQNGKVAMPGLPAGKGYYSLEETPKSRSGPAVKYLHLLVRNDEKAASVEKYRLVFDESGVSRYERLRAAGEPPAQDYQARVYDAR